MLGLFMDVSDTAKSCAGYVTVNRIPQSRVGKKTVIEPLCAYIRIINTVLSTLALDRKAIHLDCQELTKFHFQADLPAFCLQIFGTLKLHCI
jgi:hypothetical protein